MKKVLLFIALLLATIGCTKDVGTDPSEQNALTITSGIATRVNESRWEEKDAIGVYMTTSNSSDNMTNVEYTTADGSGNFLSDSPIYFPQSGNVDIFAYYPYVKNVDLENYEILSKNQIDLLSATKSDVANTYSAVALTFDHLLSKVSLTIKSGDGVTDENLKNLSVNLSGISTEGRYNINSKTATTTNANANLDFTTTEAGTSSSAILIPQALSGAKLSFTTEKFGTFFTTLTTSEFEEGKEYKYTVTINQNSIEIAATIITSWVTHTGSGTADIVDLEYNIDKKVYYINSAKGLAAFRDLVNGVENTTATTYNVNYYNEAQLDIDGILTKNIDLKDVCSSSGVSWTPIGRYYGGTEYSYNGTFDGGGHEISGLYIGATSQQALFGYLGSDGVIYNLGVSGSVTSTSGAYQSAGIVANNFGTIINCYSLVDVSGDTNVGGIAAYNVGHVVNCYNRGTITGDTNVGGIVAYNFDGGYVGYCYSTGGISGETRVGGIVGYNYTTTDIDPTIKGSFCLDNTPFSIGQLQNASSSGSSISNVFNRYYLISSVFATKMSNGAWTYNDKNSPAINACAWIYNEDQYPTLEFNVNPEYVQIDDIVYNSFTEIYSIYSGVGLKAFAAIVNGSSLPEGLVYSGGDDNFNFTSPQVDINGAVMNDIQLDKICGDGIANWTPIGNHTDDGYGNTTDFKYTGDFDGGGNIISGLYIDNSPLLGQGLFGEINGATIKNVGVSGDITAPSSGECLGGIVGYSLKSSITSCFSSIDIVSSYNKVGGIVGSIDESSTVKGCYNSGDIEATSSAAIGGIVGYVSSTSSLTSCYSYGSISANSSTNYGGVAGYNRGTINYCYYDTTTVNSGTGETPTSPVGTGNGSTDNTTGLTTTEISTNNTLLTNLNQGAADYWKLDLNPNINKGYPILEWQKQVTE